MVKRILLTVVLMASILSPPDTFAQKSKQPRMIGEVPITREAPPPADQKSTADSRQPMKEKTAPAPEATTKSDYEYYLKSGHRSKDWNEFIEPAFQSFDSENLATASIFLQRAYDKGCRDPLVLFRLAIFKESRGNYTDAARLLTEAIEGIAKYHPKHPISVAIHKHAGRVFFQTEKYSEALPHLIEALKSEPGDFMLLFMAGQILNEREEPDKARVILEKALTSTPPEGMGIEAMRPVLHGLILATYKQDDLAACMEYINRLLAIDPADSVAHSYRQKIAEKVRKTRELEILEKITK